MFRLLAGVLGVGVVASVALAAPAVTSAASTVSTVTFAYTGSTQTFTVPANVYSLTVTATGAEGGLGGRDSQGEPLGGGYKGQVSGTVSVTPGDVITVAVGSGGARGNSSTAAQSRAAAGTNPVTGYNGGLGGMPGNQGSSGGGGGGGAATLISLGSSSTIVAAGAGGGGGSGQWTPLVGRQAEATHKARTDAAVGTGQNGYDVMSLCNGNCDGGGSGAGGGGAQGGAQGTVEFGTGTYTEWLGYGGFPGANSTANFSGLSASYVYFATNSGNGSASISYSTGSSDAPTSVIGTSDNGSVALTWTAPTNVGGSAVSDYVVEHAVASATPAWSVFADGTSADTATTVTGLTNDTAYVFRVSAVNSFGTGATSVMSDRVTPSDVPVAPSLGSIVPRDAALSVSFTQVAPGSPVTGYEYQIDGGAWAAASGTASPLTIPGLLNGTPYSVRLRAVNAIGTGPASDAVSASPIATPGAPSITAVTPGVGSAAIDFAAGFDGGGSITGYQYRVDSGAWLEAASASSPLTVTGLDAGTTYTIQLRATNSAGQGSASAEVVTTTPSAPSAPTVAPIIAGDRSLTVAVTPGATGGSLVTSYQYQLDSGSWVSTGAATSPFVITALANGTDYDVRVRAVNAVGTGAASAARAQTPATTPGAPAIIGNTVSGSDARLSAAFTPPASNGGSAITGYEYSTDGGATWRTRATGTTASPLVITTLSSDGTTPLSNGTTYYVEVRAVNGVGPGIDSGVAPGIARTAPSAPAITSVTGSPESLRVVFAPASNGGSPITGYEYSLDSGTWTSTGSLGRTFDITGLTNGSTHTVSVRGVNAEGIGAASAPVEGSAVALPGQPAITRVTPTDGTLTLAVEIADNGGAAITAWQYSTDGGDSWRTAASSASPLVIVGLVNGENYPVLVRALNSAGTGIASDPVVLSPRAVPARPATVVTAGDGSASVSFTVADDGGSPVTAIQYRLGGGAWTGTGSLSSPFVIGGLGNGTAYPIEVRAVNVSGGSAVSASTTVTPRTVPTAPTGVTVESISGGGVVNWTAPASTGGSALTGYVATAYASASSTVPVNTCAAASADCTIDGLANGTTYYVSVVAQNAAGTSAASSPRVAVTPYAKPAAPSPVSLTPANTYLTLAFTAGNAGSSAITHYEYQLNGGAWVAANRTTSPLTISSLTNGTSYSVVLRAVSAVGAGPASSSLIATPYTLPDAPASTTIVAEPGSTTAKVTWVAPNANGSTITGYTVVAWSAATQGSQLRSCTTTGATECTITGLTNGTTYYVTIDAANASGTSTRSTPRVPVVYVGAPGRVTGVAGSATDGGATLAWTAGATGTSATSDYTIWYRADGDSAYTRFADGISTATSATVTGLTNGASYSFVVYAVNGAGTSIASAASAAIVPTGTGVAPTFGPVARLAGGFSFEIANLVPSAAYGLTAGGTATVSRTGSVVTVGGLTDGAVETVTVTVTRAGYTSASAQVSGSSLDAGTLPSFGPVTRGDGQFSFDITNTQAGTGYTVTAVHGTASLDGSTVTVTGLGDGEESTVTVAATSDGHVDAPLSITGAALGRLPEPELQNGTVTPDSFEIVIGNYSAGTTYTVTSTSGSAARSAATVTVSGLQAGENALVTVEATRDGYLASTTGKNIRALQVGAAVGLSAGQPTADGFTLLVSGLDSAYSYAVTTTAGTAALDNATVTVTGLPAGASAQVTVTATRAGHTDAVTTAQASALASGTAPAAGDPVATPDGFTVEIDNLDDDATYTATTTAGAVTLIDGTVTVTGLEPGAQATVTVVTARPGAVDASAAVTASALRTGTVPTFSAPEARSGGFAVTIANHSADVNYAVTVDHGGSVVRSGDTVTVTGLGSAVAATVTITATRPGHTSAVASIEGVSVYAAPAPVAPAAAPVAPEVTPVTVPAAAPSTAPTTSAAAPQAAKERLTGRGATPPVIAERAPGTAAVMRDGKPVPSELTQGPTGSVLTYGGMTFSVEPPTDGTGGTDANGDLTVQEQGNLSVHVTGFQPGTEIEVWGFSTPRLLDRTTIAADTGTSTVFTLPPEMLAGHHTLVVEGISTDGVQTTMAIGFIVTEAPVVREVTTAPQPGFPWWIVVLAALLTTAIVVVVAVRRRRANA